MNKKRSNGKHDNLGKNLLLHNCRQVVVYIIISVRRGRDTALKKNCQMAGVRVFFFFLDSGFFYVASHSSLGFCISESFS